MWLGFAFARILYLKLDENSKWGCWRCSQRQVNQIDAFLRQCSASGCNQLAYKCQKIENARTFGGMDAICEKVDFYEEVLCETGKTVVPYTKGYLRNHDFEGTYTYVVA